MPDTRSYLDGLPAEIIEKILCYLVASDLFACSQLCHRLHLAVEGSLHLKYLKVLKANGYAPCDVECQLTTNEQLSELVKCEDAWTSSPVLPVHTTSHILPSGFRIIHVISEFVFAIGMTMVIRLVRASHDTPEAAWHALNTGPSMRGSRVVLDIAGSLEENLLATISSYTSDSHDISLEVRLFSLSSGEPHPDAASPVVTISPPSNSSRVTLPWIDRPFEIPIIVGGDKIVFSLRGKDKESDVVTTYCLLWKQGRLVPLRTEPMTSGYCTLQAFVRHDLLLFFRPADARLELCHLSPDPTHILALQPLLYLALPKLAPGVTIDAKDMTFASAPSQSREKALSWPFARHLPFVMDPTLAVMKLEFTTKAFPGPAFARHSCMISCKPMLDIADATLINLGQQMDRPFVSKHTWKISGESGVGGGYEETLPTQLDQIQTVDWKDWGAKESRWISGAVFAHGWRALRLRPEAGRPISVLDFNPNNIRRASATPASSTSGGVILPHAVAHGNTWAAMLQGLPFPHFRDEVLSALPYFETELQEVDGSTRELYMNESEVIYVTERAHPDTGTSTRSVEILTIYKPHGYG